MAVLKKLRKRRALASDRLEIFPRTDFGMHNKGLDLQITDYDTLTKAGRPAVYMLYISQEEAYRIAAAYMKQTNHETLTIKLVD